MQNAPKSHSGSGTRYGIPRISIGILAHNEADSIGLTLDSLFSQDVFRSIPTEVVVIPNGCSDATTQIATNKITEWEQVWSTLGSARVEELAIPGKSNAWNEYVHRFSSDAASFLILMDADIELLQRNAISSMVRRLEETSEAVVCVDVPIKDIELKAKPSLFERLLKRATPQTNTADVPLCGQFYCVRRKAIKKLVIPEGITCDDGFLRALLLTEGFTEHERRERIVLEPTVSHKFTSVSSLVELFRHEKWIVSGSIVNMLLFERLSAECRNTRTHASDLFRDWHRKDPQWLKNFIRSEANRRGWKLLPSAWWTRRFRSSEGLSRKQRIFRIPLAVAAALVDWIVFSAAIFDVRRGRAFGYWLSTQQSFIRHSPS